MDKEIKKLAVTLKAVFNIGKNQLTDSLVESVDLYLTKNQIVKIKVLSAIDSNDVSNISAELSKRTNSKVILIRGFTFVLYREE